MNEFHDPVVGGISGSWRTLSYIYTFIPHLAYICIKWMKIMHEHMHEWRANTRANMGANMDRP